MRMSSIRDFLRTRYDSPSSAKAPTLALSREEQRRLLETVERLAGIRPTGPV